MYDIIALGEVFIDFTPLGKTAAGRPIEHFIAQTSVLKR